MQYEVRYLIGGKDRTDLIEASDAAEAASTVHQLHGRTTDSFELLSVHLVEELDTTPLGEPSVESGSIE